MTKNVRDVFIITFVPIILMMLAIYIFRDKLQDESGENMDNTLIVGTTPDYPPFEFIEDSDIKGFDIDLIKIIASKMGKEARIKRIKFSALVSVLNSNEVDMIISAFSATPERAKSLTPSAPYYTTSFSIITKKEKNINSLEDLPKGSRVGVQTDSTMQEFIHKFSINRQTSFNVLYNASNASLIEKLKKGDIDAVIVEKVQAPDFVKNAPELVHFPVSKNIKSNEKQSYVIGLKKGSKVVNKVNKIIDEMNTSGEMDKLLKKWKIY